MPALSPQPAAELSPARNPAADAPDELSAVLTGSALRTVFQPVVDLRTGRPVALEAFVRGPQNSALSSPAHLFRAAAQRDRVADLDTAARSRALAEVARAGLGSPWTLFLNASLDSFEHPGPALVDGPRLVVDVPGRALVARPAAVLRLVARIRALGHGVALDDLGADTAALALLPVVRPDVVKVDLRLLARRTQDEIAACVAAVGTYAERSGALVLAESVESEEDRRTARALGADLAQGWLLGRPGSLADVLADSGVPASPLMVPAPADEDAPLDPFTLPRRTTCTVDVVQQAARYPVVAARRSPEPAVVVTLGGDGARRLADDAGGTGVRAHAPLAGYGVAVLGPHTATLVLGRPAAEGGHVWELVTSHDPSVVARVVREALSTERPTRRPADAPRHVTTFAPLSSGLSRTRLTDQVGEAIETDRRTGTGTGLLLVGVDGTCEQGGREAVVRRMRRAVRSVDRWIPLGDQFAVLLTGLPRSGSEGVVERVADALLMAAELAVDDHPTITVSIGATLAPSRAMTGAEAHRQALAALDAARGAGGHCARIWPV
jgi:EAL domain-containing protein (putative c-di-GMP-specific phosphodiesterase class I)